MLVSYINVEKHNLCAIILTEYLYWSVCYSPFPHEYMCSLVPIERLNNSYLTVDPPYVLMKVVVSRCAFYNRQIKKSVQKPMATN